VGSQVGPKRIRRSSSLRIRDLHCGPLGNNNHAASIPIVSKYTKLPPEILAKMRHGHFAEATDLKTIQPVIDAMVSYAYIPKGFSATDLIYRAGK